MTSVFGVIKVNQMTLFSRPHRISYWHSLITIAISYIVSKIYVE